MPQSALHWQSEKVLDETALKEVVGDVPDEGQSAPLLAQLRCTDYPFTKFAESKDG